MLVDLLPLLLLLLMLLMLLVPSFVGYVRLVHACRHLCRLLCLGRLGAYWLLLIEATEGTRAGLK